MEIVLSEEVKGKLAEAVELWANDNIGGDSELKANAMYLKLKSTMIKQIEDSTARAKYLQLKEISDKIVDLVNDNFWNLL